MPRPIELLAPARSLECGIEAIRHGADAVYIGAPRFGARAAAGNSLEDLARLVDFAHPFGVRIYVTLNTLLRPDELPAVQTLINDLAAIHIDALITQDPRILPSSPPISEASSKPLPSSPPSGQVAHIVVRSSLPLHASTQMDNRTVTDVRARLAAGYQQTVLARELSLDDIRAIHAAVPEMPLEVFVHGALCVSYSGRCYASEYCFGRSANRGECAQFCRLPFDLVDAQGKVYEKQRHLLSLRDMNRAADLEALLDAGVSSLKIEGRLKDVSYVKNITAYYRQQLDAILARRSEEYCRASFGHSTFSFSPDPRKSFNRGFTSYFLHTHSDDLPASRPSAPVHQHLTPKSLGEPVGTVKDIGRGYISVAGTATFANGDGLCFFTSDGRLVGFRVNRVDQQGRLYPAPSGSATEGNPSTASLFSLLRKGTPLYRNFDAAFDHQLSRPTADRRIAVRWKLEDLPEASFRLTLSIPETNDSISQTFEHPHEQARTPQADNLRRQLLRLGDTPFACTEADIDLCLSDNFFIPASTLADWRRQLTADLLHRLSPASPQPSPSPTPLKAAVPEDSPQGSPSLMTCRYCLRHALDQCLRQHPTLRGPLALQLSDGRRFPLRFDCERCEMHVLPPEGVHFTPEF